MRQANISGKTTGTGHDLAPQKFHDPENQNPNEFVGVQRVPKKTKRPPIVPLGIFGLGDSSKVAFSTQASRFGPEGRHSFK